MLEGKQRVDGFELGATGRMTKALNVIASYTYLDSEILESNTPSRSRQPPCQRPVHSGSLWTTYKLPLGLEVGGGVRYVGARFTNVANARRVDDYVAGRCDRGL